MAQFTVNPNRHDPYKNFKFRVRWDGRVVAGVSKISGLKRVTEVLTHREGGDPAASRTMPGATHFAPITLERGVTHDLEFEQWASLAHAPGASPDMSLKDFRKDIVIELHNEQGTLAKAWKVYRCWVSEYEILGGLDANAVSVAVERLTLQNEGWERDTSVVEPAET